MHPFPAVRCLLSAATAVLVAAAVTAVALQPAVPSPAPSTRPALAAAVPAAPVPVAPAPAAAAPEAGAALDRTVARTVPVPTGRTAVVRTVAAAEPTPQQRGERALASLHYPWRELGFTIRFAPYAGDRLGTTSSRTRTITVFVKPRQDETELRTTLAHEIGHALDVVHGSDDRRARYREVRGLPRTGTWFPCSGCSDVASPAGDWAEVFAVALVGAGDFRSRMAGPPSAAQLRQLAPLFALPEAQADEPAPAATDPDAPASAPAEPEPSPEPTGTLLPLGRGLTA